MKKFFIFLTALFVAASCTTDTEDSTTPPVEIEYLTGTIFSLSEFGQYCFPSGDTWEISDQSATTADFEGISAAIEYISRNDYSRQIEIEFTNMTEIPQYAIFGEELNSSSRNFAALVSISAPNATSIGAYAFEFCTLLESVDLPLVEIVGAAAFKDCISLEALELLSATEIGYSAFNGCTSMATLNIPLVETIGMQAFRQCSSLESVELAEVLTLGEAAFAYCTSMTELKAPVVESIGAYAFCGAYMLSALEIDVVEEIGDCAFASCDGLTSVVIPSSTLSIGAGVFSDCTSLTELIVESPNFILEDGILYDAQRTIAITALLTVVEGEITLADTVTELSARTFYNCAMITSVELPSVLVVSESAFAYCSSLTDVTLAAATTLDTNAFYNCEIMTNFSAPYLTVIGERAFYNCDDLTEVYFATASGVMLESIDVHAFDSANVSDLNMYVGAANDEYVTYGDTLTVGDFSAEFLSVTVLEE
ncbi:MAG: leucine-rich repeat domain-containing protein [Rikenellaceae bacterium]